MCICVNVTNIDYVLFYKINWGGRIKQFRNLPVKQLIFPTADVPEGYCACVHVLLQASRALKQSRVEATSSDRSWCGFHGI